MGLEGHAPLCPTIRDVNGASALCLQFQTRN